MNALLKYGDKMSDFRYAKYSLLITFLKHGYKLSQAKDIIYRTKILDYAKNNPEYFFHRDIDYWVDELVSSSGSTTQKHTA